MDSELQHGTKHPHTTYCMRCLREHHHRQHPAQLLWQSTNPWGQGTVRHHNRPTTERQPFPHNAVHLQGPIPEPPSDNRSASRPCSGDAKSHIVVRGVGSLWDVAGPDFGRPEFRLRIGAKCSKLDDTPCFLGAAFDEETGFRCLEQISRGDSGLEHPSPFHSLQSPPVPPPHPSAHGSVSQPRRSRSGPSP